MFGGRSEGGVDLLVAQRYLRSTRRDAFIRFLTITAATGLALGVAALILALGMLTGFQSALKQEIIDRTPEIEVRLPQGVEAGAMKGRILALPGVLSAQLVARGQGWIVDQGRVRPVELVGFEGSLPASFPEATDRAPGLYLSSQLADTWAIERGAVIELASSRPTLSPLGPQPRVRRLAVHGLFASGRTDLTERVALPLGQANALLGASDTRMQVTTGDLARAVELAPRIADLAPAGARVATWQQLNAGLFFALRLEKSLMFVAVFLIVAVGSLALVSDLTLMIASKRREIGILGAMGLEPAALRRVFTMVGLLLAGIGVGLGSLVGVTLAWIFDRWELIRVPNGIYFLDYIPFEVRALDVGVILAATIAVAVVGAAWASRRAATLQPVEALRR